MTQRCDITVRPRRLLKYFNWPTIWSWCFATFQWRYFWNTTDGLIAILDKEMPSFFLYMKAGYYIWIFSRKNTGKEFIKCIGFVLIWDVKLACINTFNASNHWMCFHYVPYIIPESFGIFLMLLAICLSDWLQRSWVKLSGQSGIVILCIFSINGLFCSSNV